jgi:hypothetical protein
MDSLVLHRKLARKDSDTGKIADAVIRAPQWIPALIEGLAADKPALKYGSGKVLRIISEKRPDLVYPYFDDLAAMLESENSILKWGAILCLGNLACVDAAGKFELIFHQYFRPISGPVMITAANIMRGSARIALAKPQLADRIAAEILKVKRARYKTAECRNVAIGHAIDAFNLFFDHIRDNRRVIRFIKAQVGNSRVPVRKRAAKFLRERNIVPRQQDAK